MLLIDFDAKFMEYTAKWLQKNRSRFKNEDEMEAHMPEMYMEWLNAPADWLDGVAPGLYFASYTDAKQLIDWMREYEDAGISVPDQLLERIVELEDNAIEPLLSLAKDESASEHVRVMAVNMLLQLGTKAPISFCLDVIDRRAEEDTLADACAELLEALSLQAVRPILERIDGASELAKETYIDLLCNFPGDERVYTHALHGFLNVPGKRALYASYLAKLGDRRAEPHLRKALSSLDINYLDYLEIKGAIEALGGEEIPADFRVFDGDPYFESMKRL